MTTIRPVETWGGWRWIANETRTDLGDDVLEQIAQQETIDGCHYQGGEPIEEPRTEWLRVRDIAHTPQYVPEWVTGDDWMLKCSVKCLGPLHLYFGSPLAEEEVDESEPIT